MKKKKCKHDWRIVTWTSDFRKFMFGCPKCENFKIVSVERLLAEDSFYSK